MARACPVCPNCESKKFKVIENTLERVVVECLNCAKRILLYQKDGMKL